MGTSGFFRTKSIDQLRQQAERSLLPRSLTAFDLTLFGIGAIIGAGIFSTIGTAAAGNPADGRLGAGPALVVSFLITAVACGFTALCYAELASMIPIAGSAYTYAYATMGQADKAVALIEQGIAKGGLKHPEDAKLRLGQALLQSGKHKAKAVQVLRSVQGNDGAADLGRLWALVANSQG